MKITAIAFITASCMELATSQIIRSGLGPKISLTRPTRPVVVDEDVPVELSASKFSTVDDFDFHPFERLHQLEGRPPNTGKGIILN